MTDIVWGEPIEVNGVRPAWLRKSDAREGGIKTSVGWVGVGADNPACDEVEDWYWRAIEAIRLPADHPYYLSTSRGFTYWPGGESAPEDWDRGEVLLADAEIMPFAEWQDWKRGDDPMDIIGYRKRAEQHAPAIAPELVERMVRLVKLAASGSEVMHRARAILAELEPDPVERFKRANPGLSPDELLAKALAGGGGMSDLNTLASMVEAASAGGSFALDTQIAYAINAPLDGIAKPYTASLDCAMTLVLADWSVTLRGCNDSWHVALNATNFGPLRQAFGFAATPALALCAAALRSRAAMESNP